MSEELKAMQDWSDLKAEIPDNFNIDDWKEALKLWQQQGVMMQKSKPKNVLKVSFDFDSTLDTEAMQTLCKKFMSLGAEVFITTTRATKMFGNKPIDNSDLFQLADQLGIKRENIQFTSFNDKFSFVKDFDMHFDDDMNEIFLINQHQSKCMGFLYEEKFDNAYKEW